MNKRQQKRTVGELVEEYIEIVFKIGDFLIEVYHDDSASMMSNAEAQYRNDLIDELQKLHAQIQSRMMVSPVDFIDDLGDSDVH